VGTAQLLSRWRAGLEPAQIVSGLLVGLLAGVAALVVTNELKYLIVLLLGWMVALVFVLSGNFRLACLCSLLALAPLRLGKAFHVIPHMGGAAGFWIDGIDLLLAVLLWFQWRDRRTGRFGSMLFHAAMWMWVGMIALGLLSVLIPPYRMVALHEVVRMVKLLVLAIVVFNEVRRPRQIQLAFVILMGGVLLNSLLAIAQWALKRDFGLEFLGEANRAGSDAIGQVTLLTRDFVYRPGGLMGAGNLFAAYLAMLVPMAVAVFLAGVRPWLRLLSAAVLITSLPALVLTLSRSGWLAFAVGFVVVLVLGMWHPISRRRFFVARAAAVGGVALLGLAMSPVILQRLTSSDPNAVKVRVEWLETAWKMIEDKPVLGIGLNKYVFTQTSYGPETTPEEMNARYGELWPVVHSTWAVTWAEQGTVGMLLFVLMHLILLREGWQNLRIRDPLVHAVAVGLLAGLVAIMVDGAASFFLRMEQHSRVFWVAVPLLLACAQWRRHEAAAAELAAEAAPPPAAPGGWLPPRGRPLGGSPGPLHGWLR
jgi:putative inorganic carbon (HCO3(-)) transporter